MKLITKAIEKKLLKNADIENATGETQTIELKIFDPYGRFTFYVSSMDSTGRMFGYTVSPLGPDCDEWGYGDRDEIASLMKFGRPRIERDKWFDAIDPQEIRNGARP